MSSPQTGNPARGEAKRTAARKSPPQPKGASDARRPVPNLAAAAQVPVEWLTVEELAAELKVPPRTVYRWNAERTGPLFHRYCRYKRSDVDLWVAARADHR